MILVKTKIGRNLYLKEKASYFRFRIPKGVYCYRNYNRYFGNKIAGKLPKFKVCPFWTKVDFKGYQNNGYCKYLQTGDFIEDGTFLLWDQCKECGINEPNYESYYTGVSDNKIIWKN